MRNREHGKFIVGHVPTLEMRRKISKANSGSRNYSWKGNNINYNGLHKWRQRLGHAVECLHCGKKGEKVNNKWNIDWAKIKGKKYERNENNFIGLCRRCHIIYDKTNIYLQ